MYKLIYLVVITLMLLAFVSHVKGQLPAPKVSFVVITSPRAVGNGFRTSSPLVRLKYTSDARFGPFVISSHGGDRGYSATVPEGGAGVVDMGLQTEGQHDVYVTVVATRTVNGVQAAAGSPRVKIIYDVSGPLVVAAGRLDGNRLTLRGMIMDDYSPISSLEVIASIDERTYHPTIGADGTWELSIEAPPPSRLVDGITVFGREILDDGTVQKGESVWLSGEELD